MGEGGKTSGYLQSVQVTQQSATIPTSDHGSKTLAVNDHAIVTIRKTRQSLVDQTLVGRTTTGCLINETAKNQKSIQLCSVQLQEKDRQKTRIRRPFLRIAYPQTAWRWVTEG